MKCCDRVWLFMWQPVCCLLLFGWLFSLSFCCFFSFFLFFLGFIPSFLFSSFSNHLLSFPLALLNGSYQILSAGIGMDQQPNFHETCRFLSKYVPLPPSTFLIHHVAGSRTRSNWSNSPPATFSPTGSPKPSTSPSKPCVPGNGPSTASNIS